MPYRGWDDRSKLIEFVVEHELMGHVGLHRLLELTKNVDIQLFQSGPLTAPPWTETDDGLILDGRVELRLDGRIVDTLEPGDRLAIGGLEADVIEDTICWRLPAHTLESSGDGRVADVPTDELAPVSGLDLGPWVEVDASSSVLELARRMSEIHVSGAVVRSRGQIGIVTDRDIRARLVSPGLGLDQPISTIATVPARTIEPGTTLAQARDLMMRHGIHHLPVVAEGAVSGVLTDVDLLGHLPPGGVSLRREIEASRDLAELVGAGSRVRETLARLVKVGVDVEKIGVFASVLTDSLAARLIELAESHVELVDGRFAWIALGSWGRREQGLVFDQDHAIVHAESDPSRVDLLLALAAFVEAGFERCGIPRCPSDIMATSEGWHGHEREWEERLAKWMAIPERKATFLAATALDGRGVVGNIDLGSIHERMVQNAATSPAFLNGLSRLATDIKVPLGFLGDLVTTEDGDHQGLDLKLRGILPLTLIARRYGLSAGVGSAGTTERLTRAADAGVIETEVASGLCEGYRLFRRLVVSHHQYQLENRMEPDAVIDPRHLGPIERRSLREAFGLLRRAQRRLVVEMQPVRWR